MVLLVVVEIGVVLVVGGYEVPWFYGLANARREVSI